jgi:hypothetical protein
MPLRQDKTGPSKKRAHQSPTLKRNITMVEPFAWSSDMAMVLIAISLRQPLCNGLVKGADKRILFYFVNWSRNKLISKSIDYRLVIYTISQQFDPPNNGIMSNPFVIAQRVVSPTSFPSLPLTFGWGLAEGMQQRSGAAVGICVAGVNLHTNQQWWWWRWHADGGGWRQCGQCDKRVNEDNNNNMTTTQQHKNQHGNQQDSQHRGGIIERRKRNYV